MEDKCVTEINQLLRNSQVGFHDCVKNILCLGQSKKETSPRLVYVFVNLLFIVTAK